MVFCKKNNIVFESVERGQSINLDKQKKKGIYSQIMKIPMNPYPFGEGGRSVRLLITSISLLISFALSVYMLQKWG